MPESTPSHVNDVQRFRRVVLAVMALNLGYFAIEIVAAIRLGSVSLIADSVDFLEDGAINLLIFLAAVWPLRLRARVGTALTFVFLVPASAALWMTVIKIMHPERPEPIALTVTALGALIVNVTAASLLVRFRNTHGSLAKAAWLSARNDALANIAIIAAAIVSVWVVTGWIDIIVGVGIALINIGAAREVWEASRAERLSVGSAEA